MSKHLCVYAASKMRAVVMVLSVAAAAAAHAAEPCDIGGRSDAPYEISCGGKSECTPSSVLDLKPTPGSAAVALRSVCLIGGGPKDTFSEQVYRREVAKNPPTPAVAINHGLSGNVAAWLRDDAKRKIMQAEARLPLTVVVVDANDARFEARLLLDMAGAWASGELRPMIEKVECEPCRVGGEAVLTVANLAAWKAGAKADPAKLVLTLDGVKMPHMVPSVNVSDGLLRFPLLRFADKGESTGAWLQFLPKVLGGDSRFDVGLADDKGAIVESRGAATFSGSIHRLGVTVIPSLVLVVALYRFGRKSKWAWLRDDYESAMPDDADLKKALATISKPVSLARGQMLCWTAVVVISWIAIGASAGDWFTITNTALLLMGLGAGTTLGSMAVGVPKKLAAAIKAYIDAAAADKQLRRDELTKLLTSEGWAKDIASNYGEGAGLHRVQMLLFAVIFGVWAVWRAYSDGSIPELSTAQLALLGISASSYVGFKVVSTSG